MKEAFVQMPRNGSTRSLHLELDLEMMAAVKRIARGMQCLLQEVIVRNQTINILVG